MYNAQSPTLLAANYAINYNGTTIPIKDCNVASRKVLCLWRNGGGSSDATGYYGFAHYDLYVATDWGRNLTKIGSGSTDYDGIAVTSSFNLRGESHQVNGFAIDDLFMQIFKK